MPTSGTDSRPEIELAWHRARGFGLDPGMEVRQSVLTDIDRRSRLIVAAEPVLDRMAQELSDTRFTVLLADSESVIVDRRLPNHGLSGPLERVKAVPGSRYIESVAGTNALATAFELRRGISVTGDEHYLEALRQFCCYGAPILHPATRRLEGVLDVTGHVHDTSVLLPPFLLRAVRDIEQQLLEGARLAERNMLAVYQARGARCARPMLVLSDEVLLANRFAVDALRAEDHARLRELASETPSSGVVTAAFELASGYEVTLQYERIPDSPGGVIFDIVDDRKPPRPRKRQTAPPCAGAVDRIRLVYGEPGTGRTTAAISLAGEGAVVLSAVDERLEEDWLAKAGRAVGSQSPVVVDDIDLLTAAAARVLGQLIDRTENVMVLTSSDPAELKPAQKALIARCASRHSLPPVRGRTDFAAVVAEVLELIPEASGRRLTPSALQILQSHRWPGNLRELHEVLRHAATAMSAGDITEGDLPAAYRISPRRHRLGLLEQAEHDTILAVLAETGGNKAQAADRLGIGRNTLYGRIRRLGIPT